MIAVAAVEFIAKNIGKIALCMFIYLVVFDVVGALFCLLLDIFKDASMSADYAAWFVLGVFCGILSYGTATDLAAPKTPENVRKAGLLAIFVTFVIAAAICAGSYLIWWRYGVEDSYFVPDSEPLTLTFLLTVLATCIFSHRVLRDMPVRAKL